MSIRTILNKFHILDTKIKSPLTLTSSTLLTANTLSAVTSFLNDTIVPHKSSVTQGK